MKMPFQIIAVTNRHLCDEPLPHRVAKLCAAGIDRVIVREKDLIEDEYAQLLDDISYAVAPEYRKLITVNTFVDVAYQKGIVSVQMPMKELEAHPDFVREFAEVGVSIHSLEEAHAAQKMEARFAIAGHIFTTDCKAGIEPRGLRFLAGICHCVTLPIYAIGGIDKSNIESVRDAGASGACLMSSMMTCADPAVLLRELRARVGQA